MAKGMERNKPCRFKCGKIYANDYARTNHETHCKNNENRGHKPLWIQDHRGNFKYGGIKT